MVGVGAGGAGGGFTYEREVMNGQAVVKAINEWEATEGGQRALAGTAQGEYLRNRLHSAFNAGIEAAESYARQSAMEAAAKKMQGYFDRKP